MIQIFILWWGYIPLFLKNVQTAEKLFAHFFIFDIFPENLTNFDKKFSGKMSNQNDFIARKISQNILIITLSKLFYLKSNFFYIARAPPFGNLKLTLQVFGGIQMNKFILWKNFSGNIVECENYIHIRCLTCVSGQKKKVNI